MWQKKAELLSHFSFSCWREGKAVRGRRGQPSWTVQQGEVEARGAGKLCWCLFAGANWHLALLQRLCTRLYVQKGSPEGGSHIALMDINLFSSSKDSMGWSRSTACHPYFKSHCGLPVQVQTLSLHLYYATLAHTNIYILPCFLYRFELGTLSEDHSVSSVVLYSGQWEEFSVTILDKAEEKCITKA